MNPTAELAPKTNAPGSSVWPSPSTRETGAKPREAPTETPTLKDLEIVIAQGLSTIAQNAVERNRVALAMLDIHDRRLYKKDYGTFKVYLHQRWQMSRPRGYQMLHFARLIKMSTMVDTRCPESERQARLLDGKGKARRARETDPVLRAMDYLVKIHEKLPPSERREFLQHLKALLREMEAELEAENGGPTSGDFEKRTQTGTTA